jgi:hypothetical protein
MDLRSSIRKPIAINVVLFYKGIRILRSHTGDISEHGMFINTGPIAFPLKSPVEVAFTIDNGSTRRRIRIKATVVHNNSEGIGVEFLTHNSAAFQNLWYVNERRIRAASGTE